MSVCFGKDAQAARGGLIWIEGGRNNVVLARFQHQELHHLALVHVGFGLGDRKPETFHCVPCTVIEKRHSAWT